MSEGVEAPRYPFVTLDVESGDEGDIGALLFELGALGVEQRDATTMVRGALTGQVTLIASFASAAEALAAVAELSPKLGARVGEVVGDGWRDEWKKHFEPFRICKGVVVRPPWRTVHPAADEHVIVLEPGRAFGTGLHETTSLVASILAEHAEGLQGEDVLDVGCGSGILALVALALGATSARAIDSDPDAVAVAGENATRNALSERLFADETPVEKLTGAYPFVLANIEATPLIAMAPALSARVASGGRLILSGILSPDAAPAQWPAVRAAYRSLRVERVMLRGEWLAAVLQA